MQKGAEVTVTAGERQNLLRRVCRGAPDQKRVTRATRRARGASPAPSAPPRSTRCTCSSRLKRAGGRTLSIIPKETIAPAAGPGASIVLDAKAGESVFGAWAPAVGSRVSVRGTDGSTAPLAADNLPKAGDTLVIEVFEDPSLPYMVRYREPPRRQGRRLVFGRL